MESAPFLVYPAGLWESGTPGDRGKYKGTPAIRAAVSNWQTQTHDVAIAFEAITRVRKKLHALLEKRPGT